ncbi:MAG: phospholipid/cholesterol/gamma-HCH transport system substrate-binding protein [Humisphaera sp.]|jgi:phospholipid/cholesterol/gamma-HCH transport system substrate-binding protein|nr:phospholipid/cholesterol/gamma-HCH transport system substrate-binding protein [Humisphaera sp.]
MSPYRRNILVGVVVVGAMITLGWMILKFGDRPARIFATPSQPISFIADRADGLGEGANITYRGVNVGKISTVMRTDDGKRVVIVGEVDREPPLPANVEGVIRQLGQLGPTSNMNLLLTGPEPTGALAPGTELKARYEGLSLFPPEATALAEELTATARQIRQSKLIDNLNQQITKAGTLLESANTLIGDPKLREDLKATLANVRQASETINRLAPKLDKLAEDASATMGDVRTTVKTANTNIESIGKQLSDRMEQISKTLEHFQSVASKIDNGQGTAGQLVNDPKLYQALVDSATQLNQTIADFNRLVEQWEQEGVSFKLGK